MTAAGLSLGSPIDCISVCSGFDGSDLLVAGQTVFTGRYWTGSVTVLTLGKAQRLEGRGKADLRAGVAAVDWLNSGDPQAGYPVVASGSDDGSIDLWQYKADDGNSILQHLEGKPAHDHIISSVSASSQGSQIASGSWDMQIRVWDTVAFLECGTVFTGHTDLVHSLDWRQDSSIITSGSQDKLVRQWDLRSGGCCAQMWTSQPVYAVAAHPNGHTVAAGDEGGSLTFFDVRHGGVMGSLPNLHHDTVRALSFPASDEGSLIASAGDDGRICIIPQGQPISAMKQQVRTPHKDGAYIRGLAYGGKGLYSGAWDGRIGRTESV